MAKQQHRKPPKRPPRKPTLDSDMLHLAEMLGENATEGSVEGWFGLPWRNRFEAAELCAAEAEARASHRPMAWTVRFLLTSAKDDTDLLKYSGIYAAADELMSRLKPAHDLEHGGVEELVFFHAALRCLQLAISNSDGGGTLYNPVLISAYTKAGIGKRTHGLVEWHRCYDALGVYPNLQNDENDRARRAFKTAWSRGLYHAAYSIKPAKDAK